MRKSQNKFALEIHFRLHHIVFAKTIPTQIWPNLEIFEITRNILEKKIKREKYFISKVDQGWKIAKVPTSISQNNKSSILLKHLLNR